MTAGRGPTVAIALLLAALAAAGCGLGPGEGVGETTLTVTRDYGTVAVLSVDDEVSESDTVMRVLERNAEIATRFGGGFVQSIEGLAGERRDGRSYDWLFYVNGIESPVGAADYSLHGGEKVWWDYRDWSTTMRVPAVVGSWPQPFVGGYEGKHPPVAVDCMGGGGACGEVRRRLEQEGVEVAEGSPEGAIRVLVGPWAQVREDPAAAEIEDGPEASGVFADFEREGAGFELVGLGEDGDPIRLFEDQAGLVAATRRYEAPPVWVVTGSTATGTAAAARLLDPVHLRDHYAIAAEGGEGIPLPLR